jgi:hypothetical protein
MTSLIVFMICIDKHAKLGPRIKSVLTKGVVAVINREIIPLLSSRREL